VEKFFINLRNKENLKRYRYVFMGMKVISQFVADEGAKQVIDIDTPRFVFPENFT
jgi:hypothetical protein